MSDLCWKCKQEMTAHELGCIQGWSHCHHEPKEKEKCWCEYGDRVLYNPNGFAYAMVKFCPQCGKKL